MSAAEDPILNPQLTMPPDRLLEEESGSPMSDSMADWAGWLGRRQTEIQQLFVVAYERTRDASESLVANVRERTRRLKEERPMVLLGIIAGVAFAAGIGGAVWRARRSNR
jgi:hypothetical protein